MIPHDIVDRIYETARIEDIVSDYVSLKKRGANLIGLCPFHDEKTGSFTVSPSKGIYKCFGCGKAGNAINFVKEVEKCDYSEALRLVAKRYHIEIPEREMTPEQKQRQDDRESMFAVNEWAIQWFENQLWNTRDGQVVGLSYLRQRGLRDDIIRKFRLGYSPDKSLLSKDGVKHGFLVKYLVNDSQTQPYIGTGLCLQAEDGRLYDRFHSRVIFPFFSSSGKVTGFAGRLMKQNDKVGKYVNSPTSPLFEKHNELFGLHQAKSAISKENMCYLVEGQMDVIQMFQSGIENVVASGGTSLTMPQIRLLHRFTTAITVLYDGDKAGIKAALRGIDMILQEGISIKVVLLPEGEDPDSFARSHNASEVLDYIHDHQTDFMRFKTRLLSEDVGTDPQKRSELIRSIVKSISVIPDAITRQVYIKDCSRLLDMQESILSREVNQLRLQDQKGSSSTVSVTTEERSVSVEPQVRVPLNHRSGMSAFDENIGNLLSLIVRFGERSFCDASGQSLQLGQYILQEMQGDGIVVRQPIHQRIIDAYMAAYTEPGFVASRYFLQHEDGDISQLAAEFLVDKYQLSRIYTHRSISENVTQEVEVETDEQMLPELTNRFLLELKYTVVNERIESMQARLRDAAQRGDWETQRDVLRQQPALMQLRNEIGKCLGNRVLAL